MAAGTYDIKELNNISKWVIDANSQLTIGSDAIGEIGPVDDSACDLFFSTTNKCTGIQFSDESWGLLRIESNGLLTVAHVDSSLTRYFPSQDWWSIRDTECTVGAIGTLEDKSQADCKADCGANTDCYGYSWIEPGTCGTNRIVNGGCQLRGSECADTGAETTTSDFSTSALVLKNQGVLNKFLPLESDCLGSELVAAVDGDSLDVCAKACDENDKCAGFTFVPTTTPVDVYGSGSQTGSCTLKSTSCDVGYEANVVGNFYRKGDSHKPAALYETLQKPP